MKKILFSSAGFSLIELSITLVVIGLIIAAIASGAHLMQAAQINKIISELSGYKQAVESFQLKYNNLPGDQPDATNFWLDVENGNGDEHISGLTERLQAWAHLAKSHMISGNFTGIAETPSVFKEEVNVPSSTVKGAYYILGYDEVYGKIANNIQLVTTEGNNAPEGGAISASDARIIDKKLDSSADPANGNLFVLRSSINKSSNNSCVTGDYTSTNTASFITDDKTTSCRLLFWLN